jgi:hypothetical protein
MRRTLALLALLPVLAGCGDDTLTTDEYRREARAVCTDAARATRGVEAPQRTTNAALAAYFGRLLQVTQRTTDRLAELEPPDDLARPHDAAVAAQREAIGELDRFVKELRRGGDAQQLLLGVQTRLSEISQRSRRAAQELGVPECARQE